MTAVGIKTATSQMTRTADEAVAAASVIGFPVVLKAIGPMILHKTERQAVRLNLDSEDSRSPVRHWTLSSGSEAS